MKKAFAIIMSTMLLLSGCGVTKKIDQAGKNMGNILYTQYEGRVSGSAVETAAMMNSEDDVAIYVRTGVNKTGFYVSTKGCYTFNNQEVAIPAKGCTYVSSIKNEGDPNHYVNPFGNFNGTLYKDKNGEVKLIVFEQIVN